MNNKRKNSTKIDQSQIDLDQYTIESKQRDNLQGKDLAKQLRADLGGSQPVEGDVFAHQKKMKAASSLRDKLSTLNNMDREELEQREDLPENLARRLKRLDDLANPSKTNQPDLSL